MTNSEQKVLQAYIEYANAMEELATHELDENIRQSNENLKLKEEVRFLKLMAERITEDKEEELARQYASLAD